MQCLNISNKEVKAALDDLTQILGNEDAAYYAISENNGYSIEQAPNGEPSILFNNLLLYYKGNREQAIKTKSIIFTNSFRAKFNILKPGDIVFGHPAIGKTYSLELGKYKDKIIDWDVEFNLKRDKWIEEHSNTKKGTVEYKKARNEYLIYPEKYPDYVKFVTTEWDRVKQKARTENKILFASPHNLLKMFPLDFNRIINIEDEDFIKRNVNRGGGEKESRLWKEGINNTISNITNIPIDLLTEDQHFEDYLDKYLGTSEKIDENGEPYIDEILKTDTVTYVVEQTTSKTIVPLSELIDTNPDVEKTTNDILSKILEYLPKEGILRDLVELFKDSNIKLRVNFFGSDYMAYYRLMDYISINEDAFNQSSIQYNAVSILHEIVHKYTVDSLYLVEKYRELAKDYDDVNRLNRVFESIHKRLPTEQEFQVADRLQNLLDFYQKYFASFEFKGSLYGLQNVYEFTAELLTNPTFVDMLTDSFNQAGLLEQFKQLLLELYNAVVSLVTGEVSKDNKILTLNLAKSLQSQVMDLVRFNVIKDVDDDNSVFRNQTDTNHKILNQQLEDLANYDFGTKERMDQRLEMMRQRLLSGQESRLLAIDERDPVKKTELKELITYQIKNLQNNAITDFKVIVDAIQELQSDIQVVGREVLNAYTGKSNALTDQRLVSLNKNYFGFYCPFVNDLYNLLVDMDQYKEFLGNDYTTLIKRLEICKNVLDRCSSHVKAMLVENAKNIMRQVGLNANSPTILSYLEENTEKTGNDISVITRLFGSGDKINDEAIKVLYDLVQNTENTINHNTLSVAKPLLSLLRKAKGRQSQLFETDENGIPTGFMIRELKYGKMHKDYKNFLKELKNKLGIEAGSLNLPENEDVRVQYNLEKNRWLSKHVERLYTEEYYNLFNDLSQETVNARELIVMQIRDLKNKFRDNEGLVHYEKMNDEEWAKMQRLFMEKKQIASIYYSNGDVKPEGSVERTIADELTNLNTRLQEGLKNKANVTRFEKIRAEKESTLSSAEYKKWYDRNTRVVYDQAFYDKLKLLNRESYGEVYDELDAKKHALINMYRDSLTGEVVVSMMPNVTINAINRIDNQLAAIRKRGKKNKEKGGLQFKDFAKIVPTDQYKKDYGDALAQDQDNPGTSQVFELQHTYTDAQGMHYPKSYYSKIVPKDSSLIKREPSMEFTELDEESTYYNKNYDRSNPEYYQPKKSLYDNKANYNKVIKDVDLNNLREELLKLMRESNDKLDNLHNLNEYKLPQINGTMYRFLKSRNFLKGAGNYLLDELAIRNDDPGYGEAVKTSPDGTSLSMVPQYFIKDLENPETISADMVGSILMFYRMAENFKLKSEIKGKVENIKSFLAQRKFTGTTNLMNDPGATIKKTLGMKVEPKEGMQTNIYQFAKKFIDMNVYDVKTNSSSFHILNKKINYTKLVSKLKNMGTLVNLGLNFACAFTGFFTALHNHLINTLTGRYYTFSNALHSFSDIIYDLFKYGISAGNTHYKSELMLAMDYFEVGSSIDSLIRNTNQSRIAKVFAKEWAFGVYSASDYFIKGQILNCVMYDYRNVNGQFISHEEYKNTYGNSPEAKEKWSTYKTFKGSIKWVAGIPKAKNPKDQEAIDYIKFTIGNTAKNLAGSADGMLNPLQKAQFSTNVFGALCMMHRQYLPLIFQLNWTMSEQWDYTSKRKVEALMRTPVKLLSRIWNDRKNTNMLSSFYQQFILNKNEDESTRTNIRKLKLELPLILSIYPILNFYLLKSADKDKKNKLLLLFAYVMMRTCFETKAPYNISDVYSTIKTPTPLYSMLDNYGDLFAFPMKSLIQTMMDDPNKEKVITRGAYKGYKKWERSFWKTTPLKNVIELNDIPSKRKYYETQITGN